MTGIPEDPADEATLWAGRLRAWPAADPAEDADDADVDDTRLAHRAEGATVLTARRDVADETVARPRHGDAPHPAPADPVDEGTVIRGSSAAPADRTEIRPRTGTPAEPTEVRPATRREASGRIAAPVDTARSASVPTGASREIYKPRAAEPVIVARQAPPQVPGAGGPAPDAALTQRRERAGRRRFIVVTVLAAIVALAAVAGVVVLLPL